MYVWTTDPSPLQQKLCDAMMGAKTSNYSEHGLTLERPRGLWATMSNMGKILAVSPHKEKSERDRWFLYGGHRENI